MATVYIETSVVSHAAARPHPDPVVRALQVQARQWWDTQRPLICTPVEFLGEPENEP